MKSFIFLFLLISVLNLSAQDLYLPCSKDPHITRHKYFTLSYSEKDEQPEWLVYLLTKEHLTQKGVIRADNFRADPAITTGSSEPSDYAKSGYDKGHLAPAGDMAFCQEAMSQSFLMSNMTPQVPSFNRGIWKTLEDKVRKWGVEYDSLYIITSGILTSSSKKTGKNGVTVPDSFYKIILRVRNNDLHAICFIIPNCGSSEDLKNFISSIDQLEMITGIDFFCNLTEDKQKELESESAAGDWDL